MKRIVEEQVAEKDRGQLQVKLFGSNRQWHHLTYDQICNQLGGFEQGIPQCATCPISGGERLGCYRYITYPVDEQFEQLIFDFFMSQLPIKDSICEQLYRDVISHCPGNTPWHNQRGAGGQSLALLPRPLVYKWGGMFSKKSLDSARILNSLFIPLSNAALVVGYARFWTEFIEYARAQGAQPTQTMNEIYSLMLMFAAITPHAITGGAQIIVSS